MSRSVLDCTLEGRLQTPEAGVIEHRGCRLAYEVVGQGPPVLFIQGSGVHGSGWRPQIEELSDRYQCLSFDNRGIGASQPAGAAITVEQMAADALVLMDAVGWPSAHVVGHSLGGLVALQLALTAPARVRSLALLCTFARGRDATRLSWDMFWLGLRTYVGTRRMRRRAFVQMVLPADQLADANGWADRLAPIFGHDLADQPSVVMKQLAAMRVYDATPRLSQLKSVPTLVVGARHDRIASPDVVRTLVENMPGCRFVEFDNAAHGVTIQCAHEINVLLDELFTPRPAG
jgi:pimeloyl-ACP methyl ester carboxylesterase